MIAYVAAYTIVRVDALAAHELLNLAEETARHAYDRDAAEWTERLDARASELAPAVETFVAAGDHLAALRLVAALGIYAQDSGRVDEVRSLAEEVVSLADGSDPSPALAGVELVRGELSFRQGDQVTAAQATEAARSVAAAVGDRRTQARAELNLARVAFRDGDADRIAAHATAASRLSDDPRIQSGARHMLGWAAYTAGDVGGAMTYFQENVDVYARRGDLVGMAAELANLGDLALEQGDLPRAAELLRTALDAGVETNSRYLIPSLLASVASLAGAWRRYAEAIELAAAADGQYEQAGLTPDPGGGLDSAIRDAAVAAVGESRARELARAGRGHPWDDAIALARAILSTDVAEV